MAFKLHNAAGYESFSDDASYEFNDAGLLVVRLGAGGGILTYSPQAWTVVEEPNDDGGYHLQSGRFSRE
jgi:hypothetical protein